MEEYEVKAPVFWGVIATVFFTLGVSWNGETSHTQWVNLLAFGIFLVALSIVVIDGFHYMAYRMSDSWREMQAAKNYAAIGLATALKGLTYDQTQLVRSQFALQIVGTLGENGPRWGLKTMTMEVPMEFVQEFFEKSLETEPFLFSERSVEANTFQHGGRAETVALTNTIVAQGWAERAVGNRPAKLKLPLDTVALLCGVTFEGT